MSVEIEEVEIAESESPAGSSDRQLASHPIDLSDEEEDWGEMGVAQISSSHAPAASLDEGSTAAGRRATAAADPSIYMALPSTAAVTASTAAVSATAATGSSSSAHNRPSIVSAAR